MAAGSPGPPASCANGGPPAHQQARRLAAEWPLLAQTLGLGYRDQWTRQHRFPVAEFVADDQGVTATVAAIAGAGLADYQGAAGYLADTWGCVSVRAEQQGRA